MGVDVEEVLADVDADALTGDRTHRRGSTLVMRARGPSDCPECGTSERAGSGLTHGLKDQGCKNGLPPAVRSTSVPVYRTSPTYKVMSRLQWHVFSTDQWLRTAWANRFTPTSRLLM